MKDTDTNRTIATANNLLAIDQLARRASQIARGDAPLLEDLQVREITNLKETLKSTLKEREATAVGGNIATLSVADVIKTVHDALKNRADLPSTLSDSGEFITCIENAFIKACEETPTITLACPIQAANREVTATCQLGL